MMDSSASQQGPKNNPGRGLWKAVLLAIYLCAMWVFVTWLETKINPMGWDLKFSQTLQELDELSKSD